MFGQVAFFPAELPGKIAVQEKGDDARGTKAIVGIESKLGKALNATMRLTTSHRRRGRMGFPQHSSPSQGPDTGNLIPEEKRKRHFAETTNALAPHKLSMLSS